MTLKRYEATVRFKESHKGFSPLEWKRGNNEYAPISTNPQLEEDLNIEMGLFRDDLGRITKQRLIEMGHEYKEGYFYIKVIQLEDV